MMAAERCRLPVVAMVAGLLVARGRETPPVAGPQYGDKPAVAAVAGAAKGEGTGLVVAMCEVVDAKVGQDKAAADSTVAGPPA